MEEKSCFGILRTVFPLGDKGLREVAPDCSQCPDKVPCLKAALGSREGLEMQSQLLERNPDSGLIGKIQRWSRKKTLSRIIARKKRDEK